MRTAYLDCFSGISGDMFLGALLDAGVPMAVFEQTVRALDIGAELKTYRVQRGGIAAAKVDVHHHGKPSEHAHEHQHAPNRQKASEASHSHEHSRGLNEIQQIIRNAAMSESTKQSATSMFKALGTAEAKIHNVDIEKIHFHEVGAVDAIVDIVCAAAGVEALSVDEIACSPLNVGTGTVECAHGTLPVPAPATLELLKNAPVYSSGIMAELVTPTGAAIVATLVKRFAPFPAMTIEKIGYGAGSRDFHGSANVLRLAVGESQPSLVAGSAQENITVLEANVDDLNPQVFGYTLDKLLGAGALDAFAIPVQMKKNRPGMLMTVLCRAQDAAELTRLMFAETSTLGVRTRNESRQVLRR
ncbi:MAG: nickel pincer cofactor biosynthesis protein LarC, partial [Acidobacteriales bacterium]|nr:nickel pincer cofactor biosynthesis protein LarC [Terriglobales bacterium]